MKPLGIQVEFAPPGPEHDEIMQKIRLADEMGLHSVWVSEGWARDAFTFLTEIALSTTRIGIGPGIVNVYSRSPATLAMTAAHMDEISGGRFNLGLGSSSPRVIEQWHSIPYKKPLVRLREYTEIIRIILRRDRLVYKGELFAMDAGFKLRDFTPVRPSIPVYFGTSNRKAIAQTGAVADGWMPVWWRIDQFPQAIQLLKEGAESAGRTVQDITVAPWINVWVAEDKSKLEEAKLKAKEPIAWYVGRMGPFIRRELADAGFHDEVDKIVEASQAKDYKRAVTYVSDRMVDLLSVMGSLEECVEGLDRWRAAGAQIPVVNVPDGDLATCRRIFDALSR